MSRNIPITLENATEAQLLAALKAKADTKKPLDNPDFSSLQTVVLEYIDCLAKRGHTEDFEHWMFEAAVEAVFGKEIWGWINGRNK